MVINDISYLRNIKKINIPALTHFQAIFMSSNVKLSFTGTEFKMIRRHRTLGLKMIHIIVFSHICI